jgi:hypothetical protein
MRSAIWNSIPLCLLQKGSAFSLRPAIRPPSSSLKLRAMTSLVQFEPPNPAIAFAIMRNSHESLRGSIMQLIDIHESGDKVRMKRVFEDLERAVYIHMRMEDIDCFPLLNEFNEKEENFSQKYIDEHQTDDVLTRRISAIIKAGDELPSELLLEWAHEFERHLKHEEDDFQPLTHLTAPTWRERAKVMNKRVITPTVTREKEEFKWYIGWNVDTLTRMGTTTQPPIVAVRVFVHSLQVGSSAEQWEEFKPIVKAHTTVDIWQHMVDEYRIDQHPDAA